MKDEDIGDVTSLILLSRTSASYICYSTDVVSEEILPDSPPEELSQWNLSPRSCLHRGGATYPCIDRTLQQVTPLVAAPLGDLFGAPDAFGL